LATIGFSSTFIFDYKIEKKNNEIARAKDFRNRTINLIYKAKSERDFAQVLRSQYEILAKFEKDQLILIKRKNEIINQLKESVKVAINSATVSQILSLEKQDELYKEIENLDPFKELLPLVPKYLTIATNGIDILNKNIIESKESTRKLTTFKKIILYLALLANSISIVLSTIVNLKKEN
jgi:hypothetical protein